MIKNFAECIKEQVKSQKENNISEKIYISRKNTGSRSLSNEEEVIEIFIKYGYRILICEDLTFYEQIEIFSKAKIIASLHGAGLTNMIWMEQGTKVIEMHREILQHKDHHSLVYYTLALLLNLDYYYIWCQKWQQMDFFEGDMVVDLNKLINILTEIENE